MTILGLPASPPRTCLGLWRFAEIMGINPVHFAGAFAGNYFPLRNRCNDLWVQRSWQFADVVGRDDLLLAIRDAEDDLARELGYPLCPTWIYEEIQDWPRHYRRDKYRYGGRNVRGGQLSALARWGKAIAPGQRATTAIETSADVAYTDEDGDGFAETAAVTVTTDVTTASEIRAFVPDTDADPGWEIRPPRSVTISGGSATLIFWSWQLVDPNEQYYIPTIDNLDNLQAIDISGLADTPVDATNMLATVDVYRVYNDTSAVSAQFFWEPAPSNGIIGLTGFCASATSNCDACELITQDGCLHIRDAERGIVVPTPATYDDGDWTSNCYSERRDPDYVKLWYYAGDHAQPYLAGRGYDPLPNKWALATAQLAVARLERPLCSCGNLTALTTKWQQDAADLDSRLSVSPRDLDNPFGTRYGEILAWRAVAREPQKHRAGGAI